MIIFMMTFRNEKLNNKDIPMNIVKLIGKINEYKGKQELYIEQSPQVLEKLKEVGELLGIKSDT